MTADPAMKGSPPRSASPATTATTPGRPARSRRGRRRRAATIVTPVALAGVTAGALYGTHVLPLKNHPGAAAAATQVNTAAVTRATITNTVQASGELSYAGHYTVANQAQGTAYTWLPAEGSVIRRGHALYEVDGAPVTLFYGPRPEWRTLYRGVTPGPDIAQLDRNLVALGYGKYLTVSDHFTGATAYAVGQWQQATGRTVTGTVPLGQVAYAPGPARVTGVTPALGSPPQPGTPVLTATSTLPVVTAQLPVTQEYLVHAGNRVTVTLPDGTTTTSGTVTAVSTVAVAAAAGDSGQGQGGPAPGPSGGPGNTSPETVTMTVRLARPQAAGNLDQAPVSVSIVSAQARNALAVPITALVALAGGGYAVEVVPATAASGGPRATTVLVPVTTGLFSDTLVQVTGPGLAVGQKVEVPSS
jgi:Putative peptidoglycan binding domain